MNHIRINGDYVEYDPFVDGQETTLHRVRSGNCLVIPAGGVIEAEVSGRYTYILTRRFCEVEYLYEPGTNAKEHE